MVAADSEPRNLNPAIVASNGVFFVASKVVEPLADAALEVLRHQDDYRAAARKRAEEYFGLDLMTDKYLKALVG